MRFKRFMTLTATSLMAMSIAACGGESGTGSEFATSSPEVSDSTGNSSSDSATNAEAPDNNYTSVVLGETGKDITREGSAQLPHRCTHSRGLWAISIILSAQA